MANAPRKSFGKWDRKSNGPVQTFTFDDGMQITIDGREYAREIRERAEGQGIRTAFGDMTSTATSIRELKDMFAKKKDAWSRGEWGGRVQSAGLWIDALVAYFARAGHQISREDMQAKWDTATDEKHKEWKTHKAVKALYDRIKAEQKLATMEGDDLTLDL